MRKLNLRTLGAGIVWIPIAYWVSLLPNLISFEFIVPVTNHFIAITAGVCMFFGYVHMINWRRWSPVHQRVIHWSLVSIINLGALALFVCGIILLSEAAISPPGAPFTMLESWTVINTYLAPMSMGLLSLTIISLFFILGKFRVIQGTVALVGDQTFQVGDTYSLLFLWNYGNVLVIATEHRNDLRPVEVRCSDGTFILSGMPGLLEIEASSVNPLIDMHHFLFAHSHFLIQSRIAQAEQGKPLSAAIEGMKNGYAFETEDINFRWKGSRFVSVEVVSSQSQAKHELAQL